MGTLQTTDPSTGQVIIPKIQITPDGGIAVLLANNTGAIIRPGAVVSLDPANDESVILSPIDDEMPIGICLGIAIGQSGWVVIYGRVQVKVNAADVPARGGWLGVSGTTIGRAGYQAGSPGATVLHFREIGHTLGPKDGADLVWAIVHFN